MAFSSVILENLIPEEALAFVSTDGAAFSAEIKETVAKESPRRSKKVNFISDFLSVIIFG